jgi:hypothetical protein
MVCGHMVFREIISAVETAFFPINNKLALADRIANLIKVHVNGFGALLQEHTHGGQGMLV